MSDVNKFTLSLNFQGCFSIPAFLMIQTCLCLPPFKFSEKFKAVHPVVEIKNRITAPQLHARTRHEVKFSW